MDQKKPQKVEYVDDNKEKVGLLIAQRLPWLFIGLVGALGTSFFVSRFESILSENIALAFFLPLIVYISDAVGTQTQTIFVRNLAIPGKEKFAVYILKEFVLGVVIGLILGIVVGVASFIWLKNSDISLTVGLAIWVNLSVAPFVALFVSEVLLKSRSDPALGSGPITTIIQDVISIVIYFLSAYLIFLK